MINPSCEKVFVVMNNIDRTEGRGAEYVYAITGFLSTAERVAKGNYVQGMDCPIFEQPVYLFEEKQYLPINRVPFIYPTDADIENEKILAEKLKKDKLRQEVLQKAMKLGLTQEDLDILQENDEK